MVNEADGRRRWLSMIVQPASAPTSLLRMYERSGCSLLGGPLGLLIVAPSHSERAHHKCTHTNTHTHTHARTRTHTVYRTVFSEQVNAASALFSLLSRVHLPSSLGNVSFGHEETHSLHDSKFVPMSNAKYGAAVALRVLGSYSYGDRRRVREYETREARHVCSSGYGRCQVRVR